MNDNNLIRTFFDSDRYKKPLDEEALRYERTLMTMSGTELSAVAYILGKFAYAMGLDQDEAREKMHKLLDRYREEKE